MIFQALWKLNPSGCQTIRCTVEQERDPEEAFAAIPAEPDLPYPQHDRPEAEHQAPHAPRPEGQRQDRGPYEQDRGRQPQHPRTGWISHRHRFSA